MENGSPVLTTYSMFWECPSIPQKYRDEDKKLAEFYRPIERDSLMNEEEKTKHMIEWYKAANALLRGVTFPRQELLGVGQRMIECYRDGVHELVAWSQRQQVPVLVFSAGLGDSVQAALTAAGFQLPNVKVVSNFLDLDDNDKIVGIKGDEVIHTMNKNETTIKNTEYYEMVKERRNVLLMGDSIGDARMVEGMEHCAAVVKLGFLGHNVRDSLPKYLSQFDVVLVNEPSMRLPNAILQLI
ncbi:7-methylguanosine phosphate-specific 5'-nucleotidase-like isoform X1 [Ostrinia furnacalis]|uniref:7-methylguanosine phosphate-specific 5'-nucleotidase-like isoform X1 n=3 Tax=Ostrinia furnacalis TaxID=93504 RepID=UPI00103D423A|nr:7-methylguanosine phosphate-specific 5'-nucleotidase-like isoform X1 [Ostrinia furnacalis]